MIHQRTSEVVWSSGQNTQLQIQRLWGQFLFQAVTPTPTPSAFSTIHPTFQSEHFSLQFQVNEPLTTDRPPPKATLAWFVGSSQNRAFTVPHSTSLTASFPQGWPLRFLWKLCQMKQQSTLKQRHPLATNGRCLQGYLERRRQWTRSVPARRLPSQCPRCQWSRWWTKKVRCACKRRKEYRYDYVYTPQTKKLMTSNPMFSVS